MIVGVLAEVEPGERRVALIPAVVPQLAKAGMEVLVQAGAGERAGFPDAEYAEKSARLTADRGEVYATADVLVHAQLPAGEAGPYRAGQTVLGLLNPLGRPELMRTLADKGLTVFALELLPRITRAQSMDALTSMATVSGYKAVLMAADALDKMFPLLMTAFGTIQPARVFVVGAGVAGLQAVATARRLGAVVQAYDIRPAVKEEVESLGAKFVELALPTEAAEAEGGYAKAMGEDFYRRQAEAMAKAVAESDVVITTAAVPGRQAPRLVTAGMVRGMRPGSVVVDLAAETGGNCELTRPGETVEAHGVTVLGPVNLPSRLPRDASQMYARNLTAFLKHAGKDGRIDPQRDDPILRETLVARGGQVVHPRVRKLLGLD